MDFSDLSAHPALRRALAARGYTTPTAVQSAVVDPALRGRDLLVSSRTGSGKTVAFGMVLAETLLGEAPSFGPAGAPRGLVVAPTRELAQQVQGELSWLFAETGARVVSCVGGVDPRRESRLLAAGTHLIVGTPGRLRDHLDRRNFDPSQLGVVVLDEADEMLDIGFREELEALLSAAPASRRTVLFSATLPKPILDLARKYTREPARVAATPPEEANGDISFRAYLVAERERDHAIVNVLRRLEPKSALVFRATREAAHHTGASLSERGFQAVSISGELTQSERMRALKMLRDGQARVLVATDVAARGLDLPGIELVLHADLPRDPQALQHRSGRTGRAGRKGLAVLLSSPSERFKLERLLRSVKIKAEWVPLPTPDEIRSVDEERLAADVATLAVEATEEELAVARRLVEGRAPLLVAAALVRRERSMRPAPEELPESARVAQAAPVSDQGQGKKTRRGPPADPVWFRLSLGRDRKADPRWILPLLCRRGEVTRDEIGKIVVLPHETRFQIAGTAASRFAKAARRPDRDNPGARIEPFQERVERRPRTVKGQP